jgi:HSP20 family molecular chaperone IbpA
MMFPWNNQFPFQKEYLEQLAKMNPQDFQNFMNEIMGNLIPQIEQFLPNREIFTRTNDNNELNEEVFETHDYVYIKIPMNKLQNWRSIKVYHTSFQCMIKSKRNPELSHKIHLPSPVHKKGAKAVIKNDMLEIRVIKVKDWQYTEIEIQSDENLD